MTSQTCAVDCSCAIYGSHSAFHFEEEFATLYKLQVTASGDLLLLKCLLWNRSAKNDKCDKIYQRNWTNLRSSFARKL